MREEVPFYILNKLLKNQKKQLSDKDFLDSIIPQLLRHPKINEICDDYQQGFVFFKHQHQHQQYLSLLPTHISNTILDEIQSFSSSSSSSSSTHSTFEKCELVTYLLSNKLAKSYGINTKNLNFLLIEPLLDISSSSSSLSSSTFIGASIATVIPDAISILDKKLRSGKIVRADDLPSLTTNELLKLLERQQGVIDHEQQQRVQEVQRLTATIREKEHRLYENTNYARDLSIKSLKSYLLFGEVRNDPSLITKFWQNVESTNLNLSDAEKAEYVAVFRQTNALCDFFKQTYLLPIQPFPSFEYLQSLPLVKKKLRLNEGEQLSVNDISIEKSFRRLVGEKWIAWSSSENLQKIDASCERIRLAQKETFMVTYSSADRPDLFSTEKLTAAFDQIWPEHIILQTLDDLTDPFIVETRNRLYQQIVRYFDIPVDMIEAWLKSLFDDPSAVKKSVFYGFRPTTKFIFDQLSLIHQNVDKIKSDNFDKQFEGYQFFLSPFTVEGNDKFARYSLNPVQYLFASVLYETNKFSPLNPEYQKGYPPSVYFPLEGMPLDTILPKTLKNLLETISNVRVLATKMFSLEADVPGSIFSPENSIQKHRENRIGSLYFTRPLSELETINDQPYTFSFDLEAKHNYSKEPNILNWAFETFTNLLSNSSPSLSPLSEYLDFVILPVFQIINVFIRRSLVMSDQTSYLDQTYFKSALNWIPRNPLENLSSFSLPSLSITYATRALFDIMRYYINRRIMGIVLFILNEQNAKEIARLLNFALLKHPDPLTPQRLFGLKKNLSSKFLNISIGRFGYPGAWTIDPTNEKGSFEKIIQLFQSYLYISTDNNNDNDDENGLDLQSKITASISPSSSNQKCETLKANLKRFIDFQQSEIQRLQQLSNNEESTIPLLQQQKDLQEAIEVIQVQQEKIESLTKLLEDATNLTHEYKGMIEKLSIQQSPPPSSLLSSSSPIIEENDNLMSVPPLPLLPPPPPIISSENHPINSLSLQDAQKKLKKTSPSSSSSSSSSSSNELYKMFTEALEKKWQTIQENENEENQDQNQDQDWESVKIGANYSDFNIQPSNQSGYVYHLFQNLLKFESGYHLPWPINEYDLSFHFQSPQRQTLRPVRWVFIDDSSNKKRGLKALVIEDDVSNFTYRFNLNSSIRRERISGSSKEIRLIDEKSGQNVFENVRNFICQQILYLVDYCMNGISHISTPDNQTVKRIWQAYDNQSSMFALFVVCFKKMSSKYLSSLFYANDEKGLYFQDIEDTINNYWEFIQKKADDISNVVVASFKDILRQSSSEETISLFGDIQAIIRAKQEILAPLLDEYRSSLTDHSWLSCWPFEKNVPPENYMEYFNGLLLRVFSVPPPNLEIARVTKLREAFLSTYNFLSFEMKWSILAYFDPEIAFVHSSNLNLNLNLGGANQISWFKVKETMWLVCPETIEDHLRFGEWLIANEILILMARGSPFDNITMSTLSQESTEEQLKISRKNTHPALSTNLAVLPTSDIEVDLISNIELLGISKENSIQSMNIIQTDFRRWHNIRNFGLYSSNQQSRIVQFASVIHCENLPNYHISKFMLERVFVASYRTFLDATDNSDLQMFYRQKINETDDPLKQEIYDSMLKFGSQDSNTIVPADILLYLFDLVKELPKKERNDDIVDFCRLIIQRTEIQKSFKLKEEEEDQNENENEYQSLNDMIWSLIDAFKNVFAIIRQDSDSMIVDEMFVQLMSRFIETYILSIDALSFFDIWRACSNLLKETIEIPAIQLVQMIEAFNQRLIDETDSTKNLDGFVDLLKYFVNIPQSKYNIISSKLLLLLINQIGTTILNVRSEIYDYVDQFDVVFEATIRAVLDQKVSEEDQKKREKIIEFLNTLSQPQIMLENGMMFFELERHVRNSRDANLSEDVDLEGVADPLVTFVQKDILKESTLTRSQKIEFLNDLKLLLEFKEYDFSYDYYSKHFLSNAQTYFNVPSYDVHAVQYFSVFIATQESMIKKIVNVIVKKYSSTTPATTLLNNFSLSSKIQQLFEQVLPSSPSFKKEGETKREEEEEIKISAIRELRVRLQDYLDNNNDITPDSPKIYFNKIIRGMDQLETKTVADFVKIIKQLSFRWWLVDDITQFTDHFLSTLPPSDFEPPSEQETGEDDTYFDTRKTGKLVREWSSNILRRIHFNSNASLKEDAQSFQKDHTFLRSGNLSLLEQQFIYCFIERLTIALCSIRNLPPSLEFNESKATFIEAVESISESFLPKNDDNSFKPIFFFNLRFQSLDSYRFKYPQTSPYINNRIINNGLPLQLAKTIINYRYPFQI